MNNRKPHRILSAVLAALLCFAVPAAGLASEYAAVKGGGLNLRQTASLDAKVLGQYGTGTWIEVLSKGETWSKVKVAGKEGYMMTKYLNFGATGNTLYVRTNTGVGLNLRAVWTARVMDQKHVKVTVEVWLDSYSLHLIQVNNCVNVSVGESYVSANAPAVDYDDNSLHETLLATTEHVLNLADGESRSFPVQVEYHFGGVYQQQELPVLECGGTIEIAR